MRHDRRLASGCCRHPADRAPYEVDFWRHIDGVAAAVVRPRTSEEVAALVALAAAAGVAVVPQGGNTGLVGGGIPDHSGRQLVLSLAGLDRIRAVDPRGEWLVAEAGARWRQCRRRPNWRGGCSP